MLHIFQSIKFLQCRYPIRNVLPCCHHYYLQPRTFCNFHMNGGIFCSVPFFFLSLVFFKCFLVFHPKADCKSLTLLWCRLLWPFQMDFPSRICLVAANAYRSHFTHSSTIPPTCMHKPVIHNAAMMMGRCRLVLETTFIDSLPKFSQTVLVPCRKPYPVWQ